MATKIVRSSHPLATIIQFPSSRRVRNKAVQKVIAGAYRQLSGKNLTDEEAWSISVIAGDVWEVFHKPKAAGKQPLKNSNEKS